jgi:hypothetical protein
MAAVATQGSLCSGHDCFAPRDDVEAGATGGKAVNLNGFAVIYFKIGTFYGAIA